MRRARLRAVHPLLAERGDETPDPRGWLRGVSGRCPLGRLQGLGNTGGELLKSNAGRRRAASFPTEPTRTPQTAPRAQVRGRGRVLPSPLPSDTRPLLSDTRPLLSDSRPLLSDSRPGGSQLRSSQLLKTAPRISGFTTTGSSTSGSGPSVLCDRSPERRRDFGRRVQGGSPQGRRLEKFLRVGVKIE